MKILPLTHKVKSTHSPIINKRAYQRKLPPVKLIILDGGKSNPHAQRVEQTFKTTYLGQVQQTFHIETFDRPLPESLSIAIDYVSKTQRNTPIAVNASFSYKVGIPEFLEDLVSIPPEKKHLYEKLLKQEKITPELIQALLDSNFSAVQELEQLTNMPNVYFANAAGNNPQHFDYKTLLRGKNGLTVTCPSMHKFSKPEGFYQFPSLLTNDTAPFFSPISSSNKIGLTSMASPMALANMFNQEFYSKKLFGSTTFQGQVRKETSPIFLRFGIDLNKYPQKKYSVLFSYNEQNTPDDKLILYIKNKKTNQLELFLYRTEEGEWHLSTFQNNIASVPNKKFLKGLETAANQNGYLFEKSEHPNHFIFYSKLLYE